MRDQGRAVTNLLEAINGQENLILPSSPGLSRVDVKGEQGAQVLRCSGAEVLGSSVARGFNRARSDADASERCC